MDADRRARIAAACGLEPVRASALGGGCIADVARVELSDGSKVVIKSGDPGSGLELEGFMLRYLGDNTSLPVPRVILADSDLLVMSELPSGGHLDGAAQAHAAHLVAALHDICAPTYGFSCDTVIGGLPQPNTETASWVEFFRDHRILYMGREAERVKRLPSRVLVRLESLAGRLEKFIGEPSAPSLIHGDMWTGNVLAQGGRVTGFVDPAIYHADPEIELAFTTLFGTFDDAFFGPYNERRPIRPGFFEERRDLYNLYPLLVHVRLFGGPYVNRVEATLGKFGV